MGQFDGFRRISKITGNKQILPREIIMLSGLNFLTPTLTALHLETADPLQVVYATTVAGMHHPPLEPGRPALITHLATAELAGQVQAVLLNAYADAHPARLVQAAGAPAERVWACPLNALARQTPLNEQTHLYLPPQAADGDFSAFQETIAHLRAPEGCPWDREQTHQSLRPYLLEETHEVLEALDTGNPVALAEELGDLLLQVLLHTQIATERGEFKMSDVIGHINRKLWRRHPHVFGSVVVNSVDDVTANWEAIKKSEKAANGRSQGVPSALDGVPKGLPALAEALIVSKKAVRVGFEWPNIEGVLNKIIEEAHEIAQAATQANLESEIGDLLFSAVNLARWRNIDPESALRATNARFTRRFKQIEALAAAQDKPLHGMSIEEMDALWEQAKRLG
jgi:tetrapyrrole methylase family protein/MazG family protein